jgi:hypothetical protein
MQVENGDLNWCWDSKFLAFAGPHQSTEVVFVKEPTVF